MKNTDSFIERKPFSQNEVTIIRRKYCTQPAQFAMECIERWGLVMAEPDGEDTAGRQKLRMLGEAETVQRACTIAALAFSEFERRGWLLDLPEPKEIDRG